MINKNIFKVITFLSKNFTLGILLFGFSVASTETLDKLSFELDPQGKILVIGHINGDGPFVFGLDTGAEKTVISPNTNLFTSLTSLSKTDSIQEPILKKVAHSEIINELIIGNITQENFKVIVMPLSHLTRGEYSLNGIIGQDFLNNYDLEIDFPKRILRFYTKAYNFETCDVCVMDGLKIPFENKFGGLLKLGLTLNDLTISGLLDTGTGLTTVNKSTVFALGYDMKTLRANEPNQGLNSRFTNIDKIKRLIEEDRNKDPIRNKSPQTRYLVKNSNEEEYLNSPLSDLKVYRIPISKISYENKSIKRYQSIAYIELPIFRQLGFGAKPFALFGTDLFQRKTLRISNGMKFISISNSDVLLIDP
ncbi:MAG: aspartyl protease family protein [Sphingomonadales bacterium]